MEHDHKSNQALPRFTHSLVFLNFRVCRTIIQSMRDKLAPNVFSANEQRVVLMFFFGSVFPLCWWWSVTTSIGALVETSVLCLQGQPQTYHIWSLCGESQSVESQTCACGRLPSRGCAFLSSASRVVDT